MAEMQKSDMTSTDAVAKLNSADLSVWQEDEGPLSLWLGAVSSGCALKSVTL